MLTRVFRLALCSLLPLTALLAPEAAPPSVAGAPSHASRARFSPGGQTISAQQAITHALNRLPASPGSEVGANDFRLSYMGGDTQFDAAAAAVAYNSQANEYLVVWWGEDDTPPLVSGENEIFAQRVNAATGAPMGGPVRISTMGPDGDAAYGAFNPAVAYNTQANNYLVVWHGDHDPSGEVEIYGRLVSALGAPLGAAQFQISDMGPPGDTAYVGANPAVAYNSHDNQYLVVWEGDDDAGSLVNNEIEIFGQRLDALGTPLAPNHVRISYMGPNGITVYEAENPAVAYNSQANEYLVVWDGDDDYSALVNGEYEIFGKRVSAAGVPAGQSLLSTAGDAAFDAERPALAYNSQTNQYLVTWEGDTATDNEIEIFGRLVAGATGAALGAEIRLSDMGPDGATAYSAVSAAAAYNPATNEYLVAWAGEDNDSGLVDNETEIFSRRVDALGTPLGADAARLSDLGPDGDPNFDAAGPALAFNPSGGGEFLVAWHGDDLFGGQIDGDNEIFIQRLAGATGLELGTNDLRLSFAGPESFPAHNATEAAVAFNPARNEYLVVWGGDHNAGALVDEEFEIFGQRLDGATGALLGPPLRLSDMGPDGDPDYWAIEPAVVFNPAANEYLVVWRGDDDTTPLVQNEDEIFGQRVNAATGAEVGTNDFRISDMGPNGNTGFPAMSPAVAYNSVAPGGEYLVVWDGWESSPATSDEIFGQRLSSAGLEVGANDFQISQSGSSFVQAPAVTFNSLENEYLAVWEVDGGNFQVFGRRVDGSTGNPIGIEARLSDIDYAAGAAVAFNSLANEYLVVWHGTDSAPPLVYGEIEVFAQRVSGATGFEIGDDLRLSHMGPDGYPTQDYAGIAPSVTYNPLADEYLVVWTGADDTLPLVARELEIFGQRLAGATAAEAGPDDFRLSDMGPPTNEFYDAVYPAVAFNSATHEYLVVWRADDDTPPLVDNDFEIFGQRFELESMLYLPLVSR